MISGLCWNARGISNKGTISYVKSILCKHDISFCAILEPKAGKNKIITVARKLGLQGLPCNSHIWILHKVDISVSIVNTSAQHISCMVSHVNSSFSVHCSVIYASNRVVERRSLWTYLSDEAESVTGPWMLMGDFNSISHINEKAGGRQYGTRSSEDFSNFIVSNGFIDVGFTGNKYTWCNNQAGNRCIWMRLDRVLINGYAAAMFPAMKVLHLPRVQSDHCPLLISFAEKEHNQSFFSFNPAWLNHKELMPFVADKWDYPASGNCMKTLHHKMKRLRSGLRSWNWEVFGDINQKIADLGKRIDSTECALQNEWSDELDKDLLLLRNRLNNALEDQYVFLESKSHVKWLKDGDRNTSLFHAAAKVRRAVNSFRVTLPDGSISDDREEVGSQAVSFFQNLLGSFSVTPRSDYFDNIAPSITAMDNDMLSRIPSADEIWNAVVSLPKDSAPGPDGFSGTFYQACWEIIADDVSQVIILFFKGFSLPASISSTTLTLIPKVKNATSLDQVRPISLCNFIHKIISKILNDRLRPLLSKIIGEEQFGFIPGRSIHHCIGLAHDLASDIHNKVHGGNVMAKLDMSKAYDRLSWLFIIRAMKALGFSDSWCDLVYRNINNCWYSIKVRGKIFGHFKSNRGVRQGDPLSPSLFILAMEILTRKLNMANQVGGGILAYWSSIRALEINHILYADDILVFTNGGKTSFSNFLKVLDDFCCNSGQVLQPSKCKLFMSKHISDVRQAGLLRMSGYSRGKFPIRYLGAPLFNGPPRLVFFQSLVDAIKDRIEGWMKSFLSMAGRLTMIKSVLSSIPIHILSVLPVPRGTLDAIDKLLRSFLWRSGDSGRRHWVGWDSVCKDVSAGGLGIRPLHKVLTGLRGKMAWKYLCNDSLWAKHARSRFVIGGKGSSLWKTISPFISSVALDCHWRLGNGSTPAGVFCHNIAMPCPQRLRLMPISEVLANSDLRRLFLHNMNPRIYLSINNNVVNGSLDKLVWGKDASGVVTTKNFLRSFTSPDPVLPKFVIIWQSWLPMKVSCFLWRILKNALPTNDNVMKVGIHMASRCVCCISSDAESMEHLFIHSEMADGLWTTLSSIFAKPRPRSLNSFFVEWGTSQNFSKFSDLFAFGLACLSLWEVWKLRNANIFEDISARFHKGIIHRCAYNLAKCIPPKCKYDYRARFICRCLNISAPLSSDFRIFWRPWLPCLHGLTCNVAVNVSLDRSMVAAIIRDTHGSLVFALKFTSVAKHFLKCLLHLLSEIKILGIRCVRIQASHEDIILLGRDSSVEWPLFQIKRFLVKELSHMSVVRVSFSLNKPAEVLCFSKFPSVRAYSMENLPWEVQVALACDGYPHPCSSYDQQVVL